MLQYQNMLLLLFLWVMFLKCMQHVYTLNGYHAVVYCASLSALSLRCCKTLFFFNTWRIENIQRELKRYIV